MRHRVKSVDDEVEELLSIFDIPRYVIEQAKREDDISTGLSSYAPREVRVKERANLIFKRWCAGTDL